MPPVWDWSKGHGKIWKLLERYGDIQRVQRALNHSSIETTLIYAMADKLLDAKLKQAKRRKRPA